MVIYHDLFEYIFHNGVIKAWLRADFWLVLLHLVPVFVSCYICCPFVSKIKKSASVMRHLTAHLSFQKLMEDTFLAQQHQILFLLLFPFRQQQVSLSC